MNKKFNFIVLFVLIIALFSACKEPEISQMIPVKVSFYDGNTLIESSYKTPNTSYDFPASPQKNGYTFAGWELNGELISLTQKNYNLPQSSSEYIFKATWIQKSMTVSFYDGSTLIESKEILAGSSYTFPTSPTKTDCIFLGWKIDDELIPLDQITYSHEYSEEGYKYEAAWQHLYLSIDSTGAVTCTDKTVTEVVIPPMIDGIKVTSIANEGFKECESLTSIIIPDSVTSIGYVAFSGCTSLKSVTIGNSVTIIDIFAFSGCSALESITIPDSVTSIGSFAFGGCSALKSITIPNSVTTIGDAAFSSTLESIYISKEMFSIIGMPWGAKNATVYWNNEPSELHPYLSAYSDGRVKCIDTSITEAEIPEYVNGTKVTSIGSTAFRDCTSLSSITIPNSVTSIGSYAFGDCSTLESITIPDSVKEINLTAFAGCSNLADITFPSEFKWTGTSIYFDGCPFLTEFIIPDNITSVNPHAFHGCTSLTSITIPDSVTSIGVSAFRDCTSLSSITIPNSVTSIGNYAFQNCPSLGTISIPNSVESIGEYTFYDCLSLEFIYIDKEKDSLDLSNAGIPDGTTVYWKNPALSIDSNGAVSCTDKTVTEVVIPPVIDGIKVTSIAKVGFQDCTSLAEITIPDSVTEIGDAAFQRCSSLTEIIIPDSVTEIGVGAFENCSSLTSVTIPDSVTRLLFTFQACTSLESINIPDSVTSIGYATFNRCSSLSEITIPDSVTSIDGSAFANCSSLESIYIDKEKDSISDAPWGATSATVYWRGEY